MKLNKRGEVITVSLVAIAVCVGMVGFFVGTTKYAKLMGFGGNDQKTKQISTTKIESKPIIVTDKTTGQQYILQSTKTEISTLDTNEEQKMTLWEKLKFLPRLWLILMGLGFIFPPVSVIMGFINKNLFRNAKQIIGGVEESLKKLDTHPEAKQSVLDTLSKKYDGSTKLFVSKIKNKL